MESLLAGKEVMLDNLQCILQQIQLAETDAMVGKEGEGEGDQGKGELLPLSSCAQVLKAYKSGTEALKSIHKTEHVSLEEAQKTMVDLYEVRPMIVQL